MRIGITGAGGLIGRALSRSLKSDGHEIVRIGRYRPSNPPDVPWSIPHGWLPPVGMEGLDAVIHLAGEPIVGRWTPEKKRAIRYSRVEGTRLLSATLAALQEKPRVLISASAIGIYGNRGDEILDENSPAGSGFLAQVGREWEAATQPAERADIRVAHARLGVVLSPEGGALKQMLPIFRLGLGGRLGNGRQWMSWVSLPEVVGIIRFLMEREDADGPVNVVATQPVTNRQFTRTLAHVLKRPAVFPVPGFMVRRMFGELADEALLASQRVQPARLQSMGYAFLHPELTTALQALLKQVSS